MSPLGGRQLGFGSEAQPGQLSLQSGLGRREPGRRRGRVRRGRCGPRIGPAGGHSRADRAEAFIQRCAAGPVGRHQFRGDAFQPLGLQPQRREFRIAQNGPGREARPAPPSNGRPHCQVRRRPKRQSPKEAGRKREGELSAAWGRFRLAEGSMPRRAAEGGIIGGSRPATVAGQVAGGVVEKEQGAVVESAVLVPADVVPRPAAPGSAPAAS